MAKENLPKNVHVLTDVETNVLDNLNNATNFTTPECAIVKSETTGKITRNFIEIPVTIKDDNGDKKVVMRKCRDELTVSSLSTIGMLGELRKKSLKMLVLAMAKITDDEAQKVDKSLKTAKALIRALYPEYSDNTVNKYRRIGLLFSNNVENATDFMYNELIDQDVSISNLDVVITLFDKFDVEKATKAERAKALTDFYEKYIATDIIHLHASQSDLKKEVHEILNPSIEGTAKEIDETAQTETAQTESTAETAQHSIATLTLIFKGNKTAEDALAILMEELSKLF